MLKLNIVLNEMHTSVKINLGFEDKLTNFVKIMGLFLETLYKKKTKKNKVQLEAEKWPVRSKVSNKMLVPNPLLV